MVYGTDTHLSPAGRGGEVTARRQLPAGRPDGRGLVRGGVRLPGAVRSAVCAQDVPPGRAPLQRGAGRVAQGSRAPVSAAASERRLRFRLLRIAGALLSGARAL